jgi:hypothetical protein
MFRAMTFTAAGLALLLVTHRQANGGVIVNQTPSDGVDIISQVFPDNPTFSTMTFDDFVTSQAYSLTSLTALGTETGDATQNVTVTAEIWNGLPGTGAPVQVFSAGTEDGNGALNFNLGGYILPAGSYWLTAYVTRPIGTAGDQWFFDTYTPISGSEAQVYNPGGGFGMGTSPIPISTALGGGATEDLAFTLSCDPVAVVPEPSTLVTASILLGLFGAVWSYKRARLV